LRPVHERPEKSVGDGDGPVARCRIDSRPIFEDPSGGSLARSYSSQNDTVRPSAVHMPNPVRVSQVPVTSRQRRSDHQTAGRVPGVRYEIHEEPVGAEQVRQFRAGGQSVDPIGDGVWSRDRYPSR